MAGNLKLELYVFTDCKVGKARTFKIDLLLLPGGGYSLYSDDRDHRRIF